MSWVTSTPPPEPWQSPQEPQLDDLLPGAFSHTDWGPESDHLSEWQQRSEWWWGVPVGPVSVTPAEGRQLSGHVAAPEPGVSVTGSAMT